MADRFRKLVNGGGSGITAGGAGGDAIADNEVVRGDGSTGIQGSDVTLSDGNVFQSANSISIQSDDVVTLQQTGGASLNVESFVGIVGWLQQGTSQKRDLDGQTVTNSTTLVSSSDLTVTLVSGRTYKFRAELFFTTINTSGVKVAISGAATHTNIIYDVIIHGISTPGFLTSGRATAKDTAVGVTASGTAAHVTIVGTTTVSAGGTFLVQFAQNAETGAAESVILLQGSTFEVTDLV